MEIDVRIRASITIDRPPDQVFPWVENPERAREWQTEVTGGEIVDKAPGWVGTTFTETIAANGRSTELRGTVTEFAKDRCMGFHLEGDYNEVDVRFTLDGHDGTTRFTQSAEVQFKGIARLAALLLRPIFTRRIQAQASRELRELKALCEGDDRTARAGPSGSG